MSNMERTLWILKRALCIVEGPRWKTCKPCARSWLRCARDIVKRALYIVERALRNVKRSPIHCGKGPVQFGKSPVCNALYVMNRAPLPRRNKASFHYISLSLSRYLSLSLSRRNKALRKATIEVYTSYL